MAIGKKTANAWIFNIHSQTSSRRKPGSSVFTSHMKQPSYVYILASKRNGTLYVGVTTNLPRRIYENKEELIQGFTKKYNVKLLVYYEVHDSLEAAITREKAIKEWKRQWKIELIEKFNPLWHDLYEKLAA